MAEPNRHRPRAGAHVPHLSGRPTGLPDHDLRARRPGLRGHPGHRRAARDLVLAVQQPDVDAAAAEVAGLHDAPQALMTASGMAAIATTLVTLLRAGDTIVAAAQVYGDTNDLLERDLPGLGIDVVRVDAFDVDAWRDA